MAYCQLTLDDIGTSVAELEAFHQSYAPFFETTYAQEWSFKYLHSTYVCDKRRNIANRARAVGGEPQNMQHFITNASWPDSPLLQQLHRDTDDLIGSATEGALIIDESGFPKKGTDSVGVARQYCGALGKVDNCQVGVFLAYSNATEATLIHRQLYLPEEWFLDPKRLQEAGVPKERQFQTKGKLALEMIQHVIANSVRFEFIGGDSAYGDLPWLRDALSQRGLTYLLEISSDTLVWLSRPKTFVPPRRSAVGRPPFRQQVVADEPAPVGVSHIAASLPDTAWKQVWVRDGEKHPLEWEFCALRVVTRRDQLPGPEEWLILRRSLSNKADLKYAFSNAHKETPLHVHAHRMARRYWVERAIQIGKGGAGMDEYEVRFYNGWHHHMTMTLLAMLFLLRLRVKLRDKAPLLTIEDVHEILSVVLPKQQFSPQEVLQFIEERHRARVAAKVSHYRHYHLKTPREETAEKPQEK